MTIIIITIISLNYISYFVLISSENIVDMFLYTADKILITPPPSLNALRRSRGIVMDMAGPTDPLIVDVLIAVI